MKYLHNSICDTWVCYHKTKNSTDNGIHNYKTNFSQKSVYAFNDVLFLS